LYQYSTTWTPLQPLPSDSEEECHGECDNNVGWDQWFSKPEDIKPNIHLQLEKNFNRFISNSREYLNEDKDNTLAMRMQENQEILRGQHQTRTPIIPEPTLIPTIPTQEEYTIMVKLILHKYQRNCKKTYRQKKRKLATLVEDKEANNKHQAFTVATTLQRDVAYSNPIFDCGCTAPMWNHRAHFTNYTPYDNTRLKASVADGHQLDILSKGDIGPLKDVLYVPQIKHCLISSSALLDQGYGMYTGTVPKIVKENNPSEILRKDSIRIDCFKSQYQNLSDN